MKYFIVLLFIMLSFYESVRSQSVKDVATAFKSGDYNKAKSIIDLLVNTRSEQSSVWYWKGAVYTQIAKSGPTVFADQAFSSFVRYQIMDKKNTLMALEQNVGLFLLRDIYAEKGDTYWSSKQYDLAFENFRKALEVEDYVISKGFSYNNYIYPEVDTVLLRYTAAAAYSAKREDEAIPYFEKLADAKIAEKDFRDIYGLLVQYHSKKGNTAQAEKYLGLGKELFPDQEYWIGLEVGDLGNNKEQRITRLKEMSEKYPYDAALALDYGIELRNHALIWEEKPSDYEDRKAAYAAALKKAVELNPKNELAAFLLSEYYYIHISDLEDYLRELDRSREANNSKRKQINSAISLASEELIKSSLKAYELYSKKTEYTMADVTNFRKVINQIIDFYSRHNSLHELAYYRDKLNDLSLIQTVKDKKESTSTRLSTSNYNNGGSEITIRMQKSGGVFIIPCKVNGLDLNFIFDTGASMVSISLTEASFMIKNGLLSNSDIIGKSSFQTADGKISEGTIILLREIIIGGKVLRNIKASVVHNIDAPLLLGQSALSQLGKFSMDYSTNTFVIEN
ncbi:MAG: retroviral-like aspartic protease family protein [Flavisolibacter sp.]